MLTPRKHLDLDVSLLRVSAIILKNLQRSRTLQLESLRSKVRRFAGNDAEIVFLPALSFLYVLGKVQYHGKNDTLEYIAPGVIRAN